MLLLYLHKCFNLVNKLFMYCPQVRRYFCGADNMTRNCCTGYCWPDSTCCIFLSCRVTYRFAVSSQKKSRIWQHFCVIRWFSVVMIIVLRCSAVKMIEKHREHLESRRYRMSQKELRLLSLPWYTATHIHNIAIESHTCSRHACYSMPFLSVNTLLLSLCSHKWAEVVVSNFSRLAER